MRPVNAGDKIKTLPEGVKIVKMNKNESYNNIEKVPGYVFPCNEEVHWEEDFYKVAWESNLQSRLTIMFMIHGHTTRQKDPVILGYVLH